MAALRFAGLAEAVFELPPGFFGEHALVDVARNQHQPLRAIRIPEASAGGFHPARGAVAMPDPHGGRVAGQRKT